MSIRCFPSFHERSLARAIVLGRRHDASRALSSCRVLWRVTCIWGCRLFSSRAGVTQPGEVFPHQSYHNIAG